jgi:Sulfotransferase domain
VAVDLEARLRWKLRAVRPTLRRPLVWLRHRDLGRSDVILDEYPKSGGTWLAFMLGEVLLGRPVDFESQTRILPPVGRHRDVPAVLPDGGRLLRTHEPFRREYRDLRCIYLVRHPGDVVLSYFRTLKWLTIEGVELRSFIKLFLEGRVDGYGPWQDHVESWLDSLHPRVHLLRYEELRRSTPEALAGVLRFLGLETERDAIEAAIENNSLERMREKERAARETVFRSRDPGSHFVRSGVAGESVQVLGAADWQLIDRLAGRALSRLGYEARPRTQ